MNKDNMRSSLRSKMNGGFTLIELSVVLVVIGLIVGGVLVGQDLIKSSRIKAQIGQLQSIQSAVNTFKVKYNYLPGDIIDPDATNFGFTSRGLYAGEGDGNGLIEGISASGGGHNYGVYQTGGETAMFWVDLSRVGLIAGQFNTATPNTVAATTVTATTTPSLGQYFPQATIGRGNYINVWNYSPSSTYTTNMLDIIAITSVAGGGASCVVANNGLTVMEAYEIDKKLDDGQPQYGRITTTWGQYSGSPWVGANSTAATPGSSTTCYDNNNVAGIQNYSISQNNGVGVNCALSFKQR